MDGILKNKLMKIADDRDLHGLEDAIMDLSAEDFSDLETMLTNEVNHALGVEFNKMLQLRMMFRIFCKFHTDIHRGLNRLTEYEPENQDR